MAVYTSNGKQLLDVEYDVIIEINDILDSMRVISKDVREDEYALFLLEPNGNVCCYVLDQVYIVGRVNGFNNLIEAIEAWKCNEI
jgi:hypothetical protein